MENEGSLPPLPHLHTIFVDTSIDTHLALNVSLHDTMSDVKLKIRAEHALCFQDIGEIEIRAIKVRRRGFFYNLADSMFVLNAFNHVKGSWFVFIDIDVICPEKIQKVLPIKVTGRHPEVCGVDTGQEIALCGPSTISQVAIKNMVQAQDLITVVPRMSVDHEDQMSLDDSLKKLPAEDGQSLKNGNMSLPECLQVCSIDLLTLGDKNVNASNGMKVNETYLHEGVTMAQFKHEKITSLDGQGSRSPIVMSADHLDRPEILIDQEDGRIKNDGKDLCIESIDVTPFTCTHKTKSRKKNKKLEDDLHKKHLNYCKSRSKTSRIEDNDGPYKSMNHFQEINCDEKMEIHASSERLLSESPHMNTITLQTLPVEKLASKRKRKSSKLHEEAHLAMQSEIAVVLSSQITGDRLELKTNGEHLNSNGVDVCLSDTHNDSDATIYIKQANQSVNGVRSSENKIELPSSSIKVSNQDVVSHMNSDIPPISMPHNLNKKVIASDKTDTKINASSEPAPEIEAKQHRRRKKLKCELSKVESPKMCDAVLQQSNGADVCLNDTHNDSDATIYIKQANQRVNGVRSSENKIELPSSSIKVSNQDVVPHLNSDIPPISMPHNLNNKFIASDKTDTEINASSEPAPEIEAKQRRRRKKLKCELSKVESPKVCDAVLQQFNGEITESNERRRLDSLKVDNLSNQNIEQLSIDAKSNAEVIIKDGDAAQRGNLEIHSKRNRKKSKKEIHSEMNGYSEIHRSDYSCLNVVDNFVPTEGKHRPDVHSTDNLSKKFESRRKPRTSTKADINLPSQDYPTNLVQPSSRQQLWITDQPQVNDTSPHKQYKVTAQIQDNNKSHYNVVDTAQEAVTKDYNTGNAHKAKKTKQLSKQNLSFVAQNNSNLPFQDCTTNLVQPSSQQQHKVTGQPQVNDTSSYKRNKVTGQTQDSNKSHYNGVGASQEAVTKDYKIGNAHKAKITKQSSKQNSSFKALDNPMLDEYEPQSLVQLSKIRDMPSKQVKMDPADDKGYISSHGVVSKVHYASTVSNHACDAPGSKNIDALSEGISNEEISSDNTKDTRDHNSRYRVVRKKMIRSSNKIIAYSNPDQLLLASSGRMFSDASGSSSDCASASYEEKASIRTDLNNFSTSEDFGDHLQETQIKTNASKLQMDASFSDKSDEVSNDDNDMVDGHCRPRNIYKLVDRADGFTASQSELDVVLETQPDPVP